MIIYPAIDLLDHQCVRLSQGDYNKKTVYASDPIAQAKKFAAAGATWVHVVDLEAARRGTPFHHQLIQEIAFQTGLKVQTGGGIRDMKTLEMWILEVGVSRCVIGTAALKDPEFTKAALHRFASHIAIGIDAKDGEVAVEGWTQGTDVNAIELAKTMKILGAETIIYTDIARDGMLVGPSLESTAQLIENANLDVIASGGISSLEDIQAVKKIKCTGVIVGKAIYEGRVELEKCWQKE